MDVKTAKLNPDLFPTKGFACISLGFVTTLLPVSICLPTLIYEKIVFTPGSILRR